MNFFSTTHMPITAAVTFGVEGLGGTTGQQHKLSSSKEERAEDGAFGVKWRAKLH